MCEVIFESETRAGRSFDKIIIAAIAVNVLIVSADGLKSAHDRHQTLLNAAEWFFSILFTAKYVARRASVDRPRRYALSFIASVMMLIGWGTLAVPTGIVTAETSWRRRDGATASAAPTGAPVPLLDGVEPPRPST